MVVVECLGEEVEKEGRERTGEGQAWPTQACRLAVYVRSELSLSPPHRFSYLAQAASSGSPRSPMADLYPPTHARSPHHYSYSRHQDSQHPSPFAPASQIVYPSLVSSQHSNSSNASSDDHNDPPSPTKSNPDHQPPKTESKPQATFLTKLYAYVSTTLSLISLALTFEKPPRTPREPPHDSLGPRRRTYHR